MAVNEKKFTAIQGVAFLISLFGNKEGKVMEEAGNCQFLSKPFYPWEHSPVQSSV